jgi:hypothetical protein
MNEDMEISDNEFDDLPREHERTRRAPPSDWNQSLLLAGLGLTLMLGGYAALNYVPPTPRQAEQEHHPPEFRETMAKVRQDNKTVDSLNERLKEVAPSWRTPPYQMPGRLAIYGGLALFVAAGVRMYRNTPGPKTETDETED